MNATKGFKSGAFDPQNVQSVANPEKLVSYEAGMKSDWRDGHTVLNLSAFHYDYTDIQVFQGFIDPTTGALRTFLTNAAKAKVDGLETEFMIAPVERLQLGLRATLLNARYGSGSRLADVAARVASMRRRGTDPTVIAQLLSRGGVSANLPGV